MKIFTKHELWNLQNEQIEEMKKGRSVKIVLNYGEYKDVCIQKLLTAANPLHLFVGFLTTDNYSIYLQNIDQISL